MKVIWIVSVVTFVIGLFFQSNFLFGYDNDTTHIKINGAVVQQDTVFDDYLRGQIGFNDGVGHKLFGKDVKEWIEDGGKKEDSMWTSDGPFVRPLRSL